MIGPQSRIALASSLVLLVSMVAACGSDGETIDAGSGTETTQPPPGGDEIIGADVTIGSLEITVTHPDIEPITYVVGCLGDTFPVTPEVDGVDGQTACGLLEDEVIRTLLFDGLPADQMCTEIYGGPDEARIVGQIDGNDVDALITRTDGCEIDAWQSLVGLIPPAIGVTD